MSEKLPITSTFSQPEPWYKDGLRFSCTGCGKCCTGSPGYVWVTEEEIASIADYLQLSIDAFSKKYVRKIGSRFSLSEHPRTYDCAFLKDNKCTIYPCRPKQCQTYPWWIHIIRSQEDWENSAVTCEGINHPDAPLISKEEIEKNLYS